MSHRPPMGGWETAVSSDALPGMPEGGNPEPQKTDRRALDEIAAVLRGQEWDADTFNAIAWVVEQTGRSVMYSAED